MIKCPKTPQAAGSSSDSYFVTPTDDHCCHHSPQQQPPPPVASSPFIHSAIPFFHTSADVNAIPRTPILHAQHQDFYNAIQTRFSNPFVANDESSSAPLSPSLPLPKLAIRRSRIRPQHTPGPIPPRLPPAIVARRLRPYSPETVHSLKSHTLLLIDVRSFVHYANMHIQHAINVSIPNTILKRPTFTLDKVTEAIADGTHRTQWCQWKSFDHIVMYDQQSDTEPDAHSAIAFLAIKFHLVNYPGTLGYLKGGLSAYARRYSEQCVVSAQPTVPRPAPTAQPSGAPAPFFSNIRQNMELSHGSIKERIPIRLPPGARQDDVPLPQWLNGLLSVPDGPTQLAENYEVIERAEQKRLQTMMSHHAKHYTNATDHPFSIVSGLEMGALNRYTNIWPFEYTRVKIGKEGRYINASYIEYNDTPPVPISSKPDDVPDIKPLGEYRPVLSTDTDGSYSYRRYIATQGPLPATFNDFWNVVWEQDTRVIVVLTREEEMNRIKCHRYWPSQLNTPTEYGYICVTLLHETAMCNTNDADNDDRIIVRHLKLEKDGSESHTVQHIQYLGWMDFGVPDNPSGTLACVKLADEFQKTLTHGAGPMVVHCSAGCGRTGAFCTIDTVLHRLQRLKDEYGEAVNCSTDDLIYQTVSKFREQRVSMVQTLRQYVFCYETIIWWILGNA